MSVVQEAPVTRAQTPPSAPRQNGRWSGYFHLLTARMLELKREPEVVFWVFAFPLLLALGLGIAFRNKPADAVSLAIVQGAGSDNAQALLARSPQHATFKIHVLSAAEARNGFRLGKFDVVIEPDGKGGFQYRYDPDRPESVLARSEVNDALQAAAGRKDTVSTTAVTSSDPGSRYIDFLIPGLLGMNLMNSGMWGIGFALVDMRQRKLLKRFVATPMRRGDFLLALASSRLILMIIEVGLLLVFGVLFFHMRVLGSVGAIALIGGLGSLTFGGVGLLTASRAQKIESVSGLINLVMMPMWIFSGVFFSYERFPAVIHPLIKALPLTALNDALRASILQGTPLLHQWPRLLIMVLWGGISFFLALKWFRWT
ncbi:ABC multidrug efflux pump, inner membrane subunit [Candidatus Sulfotelmatobacter kueseliae]|uniref:ABC multidrug efflux pump, inner membrane subunit n=1 Tax=Candidatus Sulfotelmatobacter kueseliae TaxID=2042962 RepID=A0A2U3K201_9BACT|nr:ABC multidrug efflux pump, inner membrane subunit [Candidatus Sulfotelmatobacter kueseliae]